MYKIKTKHQCQKCEHWFSAKAGNYKKHITACDGTYIPAVSREQIQRSCKYCGESFDKNEIACHTRWCDKNPKKDSYTKVGSMKAVLAMNAKRQEPGVAKNHYSKARLEGRPIPESPQKGKTGFWLGRKHSEKTKAVLKQKALSSKHRRLRRGLIEYKGITLESSWELLLAKRLDELGIEWTRPDPIPWIDENGITHNYFPDFYLPKQNLYLDPKNPVALRVQEKKLQCLLKQYDNIIIIKTPEECETFILP